MVGLLAQYYVIVHSMCCLATSTCLVALPSDRGRELSHGLFGTSLTMVSNCIPSQHLLLN